MPCDYGCRCDRILSRIQDWLLSEPEASPEALRIVEQWVVECLQCAASNGHWELRCYAALQLTDPWFGREGNGGRMFAVAG